MTRDEYLQAIKTELDTDPTGAGLAGLGDVDCSEWFGKQQFKDVVTLSFPTLKRWAAANGVRKKIRDSAAVHASAVVQSICITLEDSMGLMDGSLDLRTGKPERSMLDALVSGGVLTTAERDDLLTTSTGDVSRAEQLGISSPTPSDIADARRLV